MKTMKTDVQHFYAADGRHLRSLKRYSNGVCPECGRRVLRVLRHSRRYVLDSEQLYLLKPNCLGQDEIYTKDGVRHRGTLVRHPDLSETYVVGYRLHECS